MIHAIYTWTEHTITCRSCNRRTRIAAEVIAELREAMDFEGQTDAQVAASIDSCNECIEGPNPVYAGEHPSDVAERLIAWVCDASFECGEWDSDDENHTYEELHGESLKATTKLREFIADLEARAAAVGQRALRSAFIEGMDKCRETKEAYGEWPSLPGRVEIANDAYPVEDDESGVLGALNSQYDREHEAPSIDAAVGQ